MCLFGKSLMHFSSVNQHSMITSRTTHRDWEVSWVSLLSLVSRERGNLPSLPGCEKTGKRGHYLSKPQHFWESYSCLVLIWASELLNTNLKFRGFGYQIKVNIKGVFLAVKENTPSHPSIMEIFDFSEFCSHSSEAKYHLRKFFSCF